MISNVSTKLVPRRRIGYFNLQIKKERFFAFIYGEIAEIKTALPSRSESHLPSVDESIESNSASDDEFLDAVETLSTKTATSFHSANSDEGK